MSARPDGSRPAGPRCPRGAGAARRLRGSRAARPSRSRRRRGPRPRSRPARALRRAPARALALAPPSRLSWQSAAERSARPDGRRRRLRRRPVTTSRPRSRRCTASAVGSSAPCRLAAGSPTDGTARPPACSADQRRLACRPVRGPRSTASGGRCSTVCRPTGRAADTGAVLQLLFSTRRAGHVATGVAPHRASPPIGTMIELPRAASRRADRRGGGLLLLRHQRPDADDLGLHPRRRRGVLLLALPRARHLRRQPVRVARPRRRRPAGAHRRPGGPRRPPGPARSASAASTAATPTASTSSTRSGSTTSPARPSACPVARLEAGRAALAGRRQRHPLGAPAPVLQDRPPPASRRCCSPSLLVVGGTAARVWWTARGDDRAAQRRHRRAGRVAVRRPAEPGASRPGSSTPAPCSRRASRRGSSPSAAAARATGSPRPQAGEAYLRERGVDRRLLAVGEGRDTLQSLQAARRRHGATAAGTASCWSPTPGTRCARRTMARDLGLTAADQPDPHAARRCGPARTEAALHRPRDRRLPLLPGVRRQRRRGRPRRGLKPCSGRAGPGARRRTSGHGLTRRPSRPCSALAARLGAAVARRSRRDRGSRPGRGSSLPQRTVLPAPGLLRRAVAGGQRRRQAHRAVCVPGGAGTYVWYSGDDGKTFGTTRDQQRQRRRRLRARLPARRHPAERRPRGLRQQRQDLQGLRQDLRRRPDGRHRAGPAVVRALRRRQDGLPRLPRLRGRG